MTEIIIASILTGCIFAPLGCFVLWNKYVYYGDGLAHASMLGGAISVVLGVPIIYVGIINTICFIGFIFKIKNKSGNNAAIGLVSSVMISLALIIAHIFPNQFSLNSLLFGDILAANNEDLLRLVIIFIIISAFISLNYRKLILIILSRDIAHSRGIKVKLLEFLFLAILSFAIISTIKIVGALLVTSIILIPAMIARLLSKSPFQMLLISILIALIMNFSCIILSFYANLPFAPIIIVCGGIKFLIASILYKK